jgi:hypothetical protein
LQLWGETIGGADWAVSVDVAVQAGVFETYAITLSPETSVLLDPVLVRARRDLDAASP